MRERERRTAAVPAHILARRAGGRRRRRRRLGGGLAFVLAASLALAVAVLDAGGSSLHRPRRRVAPRASARVWPPHRSQRLARLEASGNARIRRLARIGKPVFCGARRGHDVAFTFDDGPGPYTGLALRKLRRAGERATFFVVGRSIEAFPHHLLGELTVATIGDHTFTHPFLPGLGPAQITAEMERTRVAIQRRTGERVDLFRPPYGALSPAAEAAARRLGLLTIMWTADSRDSLGADWRGIIANVRAALHPGAIILMHENRGQTIRALTTLLPLLRRRHLRSVDLPELLAIDPPSVAQLRQGSAGCGVARPRPGGH